MTDVEALAELNVKPCGKHQGPVRLPAAGLVQRPGETSEEAYVRWCRARGRHPWCGLTGCVENVS